VSGNLLHGNGPGDPGAQPVGGGEVRVVAWFDEEPDVQFSNSDQVRPDGSFLVLFPDEIFRGLRERRATAAAFYLGDQLRAPCHSEDVRVDVN
jgi:hypothetical protein